MVDQALADGRAIHVVPGVLAQVWRGGPRQARLAAFMDQSEVTLGNLDPDTAKAVGVLIGLTGHADVVDVHVALHARLHGHAVMTSDPDDIRAVDPSLSLIEV
ncbi:hypothetical protein [Nocardioides immobilis]|nr:hypothetical protein [Nocardioides immobilis]